MGRLVQQPAPSRADRQRAAGRIRANVLSESGRSRHGGATDTRKSPEKPGRFNLQIRTRATPLIDDGEHPKRSAIDERIMDKIHAPMLVRTARRRCDTAMQAGMLAALQPMPQVQAVQPIKPRYALHTRATLRAEVAPV